jgi:hypothetical protein
MERQMSEAIREDAFSYSGNDWSGGSSDWNGGISDWDDGFSDWSDGFSDWGGGFGDWSDSFDDWNDGFNDWTSYDTFDVFGDTTGWLGTTFDALDSAATYLSNDMMWGTYADGFGLASDVVGLGMSFYDLSQANSYGDALEAFSDLASSAGGIFELAGGSAQGANWLGAGFTLGGLGIEALGYAANGDYLELADTLAEGALVGSGAYFGSLLGNPGAGAAIGGGVYDLAHWAGSEGPLAYSDDSMDAYFANNPQADGSIGSFIDFAWQTGTDAVMQPVQDAAGWLQNGVTDLYLGTGDYWAW